MLKFFFSNIASYLRIFLENVLKIYSNIFELTPTQEGSSFELLYEKIFVFTKHLSNLSLHSTAITGKMYHIYFIYFLSPEWQELLRGPVTVSTSPHLVVEIRLQEHPTISIVQPNAIALQ